MAREVSVLVFELIKSVVTDMNMVVPRAHTHLP
jgi:hypothetical protein